MLRCWSLSGWGVSSDVAAVVVSAVGLWLWCFLLSGFRCRAAVGRVVVAVLLVSCAGGASAGALLRLAVCGSVPLLVLSGAGGGAYLLAVLLCCAGVRWSAGCGGASVLPLLAGCCWLSFLFSFMKQKKGSKKVI